MPRRRIGNTMVSVNILHFFQQYKCEIFRAYQRATVADMEYSLAGFNGQRPDPVSGHSHLGNGYRAYTPVLGRFTAPDSMSPFGAGGINPYAYCAGDPVNRADPSGHFSLGQGLGMALGLVGGFVLGVLTEGMALPVVASLLANMAGDAAIGALSELTTEAVDGQQINGRQVGMAALVNAGFSLAGFGLGRLSKLKGTSNRPFGGLMIDDAGRLQINLHPASAKPVYFRRAVVIKPILEDGKLVDRMIDVAVYSDFAGTGEPGVIIHGNSDGRGLHIPGTIFTAVDYQYTAFWNVSKIDLRTFGGKSKPLHLSSCFSDNNAEELATSLGRDVVGYGDNEILYSPQDTLRYPKHYVYPKRKVVVNGKEEMRRAPARLFMSDFNLQTIFGAD
jgi:RHS repeat-associated protein